MEDRTGAELLVDALSEYGVTKVFGNPGTSELPFIDAIERSDSMDYVMTLHEDVAVGAASGYSSRKRYLVDESRRSEMLSVVSLHTTPGMAHGLGNLYGAWFSGSPVIVTTGGQRPETEARSPQLSGDRVGMVEPYTKYATTVSEADNAAQEVRKAAEIALTPPTGPVFLDLPLDMQLGKTDTRVEQLTVEHNRGIPSQESIEEAVSVLQEAESPMFMVGDQLAHAGRGAVNALLSLAEVTGAKLYGEPLLAETGVPTWHEQWEETVGIYAEDMEPAFDGSDVILYVGVRTENPMFAESLDSFPPDSGAQTVHVASDQSSIGVHYDGVEVVGDITESLEQLRSSFDGAEDDDFLARLQDSRPSFSRRNEGVTLPSQSQLAEVIDDELEDTIVVDEAVTSGFILRNTARFDYGQLLGQKSGGLGYGMPASLGVAIAEQEREGPSLNVLCYVGDGSYQYYPQTLYTADRYVENALSFVLVDNDGYKILRDSDVVTERASTTDNSLRFQPRMNFVKNAESYGIPAARYEGEGPLHESVQSVLNSDDVRMLVVPVETDN